MPNDGATAPRPATRPERPSVQNEQQRRAALAAMGIVEWVPRGQGVEPENSVLPGPVTEAAPANPEIATLDWPALAQEVSACRRCGLHQGRTQTVFGVGNRDADWMIVGEAPGQEEDRKGEPFVGRAGQLLNAMLLALGQPRERVFIANILKCRPPNNRDPSAEEAAACAPFLARQIELVAPRIILCVGRIAAQNLLGTATPIGKLRGQRHAWGPRQIPVVVTYHPAYLLRSPGEKRRAWQDLLFARRTLAALDDAS